MEVNVIPFIHSKIYTHPLYARHCFKHFIGINYFNNTMSGIVRDINK